jgi:hypothetical protein
MTTWPPMARCSSDRLVRSTADSRWNLGEGDEGRGVEATATQSTRLSQLCRSTSGEQVCNIFGSIAS